MHYSGPVRHGSNAWIVHSSQIQQDAPHSRETISYDTVNIKCNGLYLAMSISIISTNIIYSNLLRSQNVTKISKTLPQVINLHKFWEKKSPSLTQNFEKQNAQPIDIDFFWRIRREICAFDTKLWDKIFVLLSLIIEIKNHFCDNQIQSTTSKNVCKEMSS